MIRTLVKLVLAVTLLFSTAAFADEFGTKAEAIALVGKAIVRMKDGPLDKAFAEFSDPAGKWVDRDLYLIVVDKAGIRVAHGQNAKLIGVSYAESVDVNGKEYGKELMAAAAKGTSGWVDYYFTDPISKKQAPKSAYWEKAGDYIVISGIYVR